MAAMFLATSCSETYDIYPDEYSAVLRFKDGGEQKITVYSPQVSVDYPITIQKGGWDTSKTASAKVRSMTEEEFNDYLIESGAGYSYIPTNCYSFSDSGSSTEASVSFDGKVGYHTLNLEIFPPKIGEFLETYTETNRTPVIPLILESESELDSYSYELFVAPDYQEPLVGIMNGANGESMYVLGNGESQVELKIGLPFTSEWEITGNVTINADEDVLKSINDAYSTSYSLMPSNAYSTSGSFKVNPGEDYATVKVNIDIDKAEFRTALPLTVDITSDGFAVDPTPFAIVVDNAEPYKLNITSDMIYCNDVYSGDGAGVPGLVDGDPSTHCHSWYGSSGRDFDDFGSYIWIQNLGNSYKRFALDIYNRSSYNNGHVARFKLWAKNSSGSYEVFADCRTDDWLTDRGSLGCFGSFEAPFETDAIIVSIVEADGGSLIGHTTAFWSMGELIIYGK